MKFTKTRDVKCITRATAGDAGIDFFVPTIDGEFKEDFFAKNKNNVVGVISSTTPDSVSEITVEPHGQVLIPVGVKVVVPEGHALIAFNKSGVASKTGLTAGACVVDEQYRGEVHINVLNTSDKTVCIQEGMKLMQFVLIPINQDMPEEITNDEYAAFADTERGEGGFGSSNKEETKSASYIPGVNR